MLIKIRNDKYINSEKIESLVIVCAANHYDVYAHMSTSDTVSYAVSTGHKTFKEAEQAMDELAVTINNAGRTGRKIVDSAIVDVAGADLYAKDVNVPILESIKQERKARK